MIFSTRKTTLNFFFNCLFWKLLFFCDKPQRSVVDNNSFSKEAFSFIFRGKVYLKYRHVITRLYRVKCHKNVISRLLPLRRPISVQQARVSIIAEEFIFPGDGCGRIILYTGWNLPNYTASYLTIQKTLLSQSRKPQSEMHIFLWETCRMFFLIATNFPLICDLNGNAQIHVPFFSVLFVK